MCCLLTVSLCLCLSFMFLIAFKPNAYRLSHPACVSIPSFAFCELYWQKHMSRKETRRHEKDLLRAPKLGVPSLEAPLSVQCGSQGCYSAGGEGARGWTGVLTPLPTDCVTLSKSLTPLDVCCLLCEINGSHQVRGS